MLSTNIKDVAETRWTCNNCRATGETGELLCNSSGDPRCPDCGSCEIHIPGGDDEG